MNVHIARLSRALGIHADLNERARRVLLAWSASALFATLCVFQIGYSFEEGDQLQYLLLPYRQIYADFLPGDWFTWQTTHYHQTFAWIVRALHALCGEQLFARGMFALHFANLTLLGYALLRLSRALGWGLSEFVFCASVFALCRQVGLAGAVMNHPGAVPADLALAPFLLACAAYAELRTIALGLWLGWSGFLHANYAVLGALVLFPLQALRCRTLQAWFELAIAGLLFASIAAPTLWLVLASFATHDSAPDAVALTLFVRSPHHYDLAALDRSQFYYTGLLFVLALPQLSRRAAASRPGPDVQPSTISRRDPHAHLLLVAMLLGWLGLGALGSGFHILSLSRLFTWRLSIPLFAILQLCAAAALRDGLRRRAWLLSGWQIALIALLPCFAQRDPLQPIGKLHFLDAHIALTPPLPALYAAIRARTPADARFLAPPGLSQFRLRARRALFVDWKCTPMKGDEALEWRRRMLLAMGTRDFPARGYDLWREADVHYAAQPLAKLAELARAQDLTHILVRGPKRSAPAGLVHLFTSGRYSVYALTSQPR